MGKALAVILEKTNAIAERPNIQMQQLNPRHQTCSNTRQYLTINQNIRQYHPNIRQFQQKNPRQFQNVNPTRNYYQNMNRTMQPPPLQIQWTTPKPQGWKFLGRYCLSCGNYDHWSNRCRWSKRGHNVEAIWLDKKRCITSKMWKYLTVWDKLW